MPVADTVVDTGQQHLFGRSERVSPQGTTSMLNVFGYLLQGLEVSVLVPSIVLFNCDAPGEVERLQALIMTRLHYEASFVVSINLSGKSWTQIHTRTWQAPTWNLQRNLYRELTEQSLLADSLPKPRNWNRFVLSLQPHAPVPWNFSAVFWA
jgi:hypothetical protein